MMLAVKQTTDYAEEPSECIAQHAKVLVVCTDDGRFKMSNGKIFSSGNHPVETLLPLLHLKTAGFSFEFATISGGPVVLEMWAFPNKDKAVSDLYQELKPSLDAPTALDQVNASLKGYAAIYLPGGHGAMVNLPESFALGKLLHAAHAAALPTIALCHGPAALLAASKVDGAGFPYDGYTAVSFSDKTDKLTPKLGYLPGRMPWFQQEALAAQGMVMLNKAETGAVNIDRELVTGDSPKAAQKLGVVAVTMAIAALSRPQNDSAVR